MKFKLPKISIYDRYIFKQVALTSLVAILLFTIVWIAPEILLRTIKGALEGEYSMKTAMLILLYELPLILEKVLPIGLLLGTLFTFDKLSKDSEMTIFRAVGMSFQRIIIPVLCLSVLFTGLCFVISDKAIPYAAAKKNEIKGKVRTAQYIYTQKDDKGLPLVSVIVSKSRNRDLYNVIVLDFASHVYQDVHQLSNIYSAKKGYAGDSKWILRDVTHYNISNDGIYVNIEHQDKINILDEKSAKNAMTLMTYSTMRTREITNKDLFSYVKLLKSENLSEEYNSNLNKYLQRYVHPLICILLAILGCLLGFSKPREQRMIGFLIAAACIFVYYITSPFFDLLAEKEVLSPFITSTLPLFAFMFAIYCFYKAKDI